MFRLGRWAVFRSVFPQFPTVRPFSSRNPITDLSLELTRLKAESPGDLTAFATVYTELSKLYLRQWSLPQAKEALVSLHTVLTSSPLTDKRPVADCLLNLGEVYYNQQSSSEALHSYTAALAMYQSFVPVDSLCVARCYYGLGNTHQSTGAFAQAIDCFKEAETLADAAGSQRDDLVSLIYQGYASIYREQGKLEEAGRCADVAVKVVQERTERNSARILADAQEVVGDIQMTKREINDAIATYNKALSLKKVLLPAKHPEVAKSMGKLAVGLIAGKQIEAAIALFKEKLEIDKEAMGEMTQIVADDYHSIAFASVKLHLIDQASSFYASELQILESLPSTDPQRLASVHMNLLSTNLNRKQLPAALIHGLKGVEILKKTGNNKEQLAFTMGQLGEIYLQMKNLGEAKKWCQEAHLTKVEVFTKDHLEVGKSLVSLGQIMGMSNDPKSAETLITQGVAILREKLKRDDVGLAVALAKQGTAFAGNKKIEPAIASFKEAVVIFRKSMPQGAPSTVTSSQHLISLYLAANMVFEAENVLRRLIADIEQVKKENSYDFPKMVKSLYAVLQAQDKEEDCAKLRAKYSALLSQ